MSMNLGATAIGVTSVQLRLVGGAGGSLARDILSGGGLVRRVTGARDLVADIRKTQTRLANLMVIGQSQYPGWKVVEPKDVPNYLAATEYAILLFLVAFAFAKTGGGPGPSAADLAALKSVLASDGQIYTVNRLGELVRVA